MIPLYKTISPDIFDERIKALYSILNKCVLCPRKCSVNRNKGKTGFCRSGSELIISSISPHFGEERPLVGSGGSGTVFLTNCNLGCIYCQNYDISHLGYGKKTNPESLAKSLLYLQNSGCHNINFVTPTHFTPQIIISVKIASEMGLNVPIVYNCGGYESVSTLKLLDGIIDIYMPDIKYGNNTIGEQLSKVSDYFDRSVEALKEMHRQTGDLKTKNGIACHGLLIRHLVLPENLADSEKILKFISNDLSKNSYVNIMGQYHPEFDYKKHPGLGRRPTVREIDDVKKTARSYGLHRGF